MLAFAATIFLSAFLLFQVQPVIAKFILPKFGGSAVWSAALLLFQLVLLAGYLWYVRGVVVGDHGAAEDDYSASIWALASPQKRIFDHAALQDGLTDALTPAAHFRAWTDDSNIVQILK